jgi:hypothetical protein
MEAETLAAPRVEISPLPRERAGPTAKRPKWLDTRPSELRPGGTDFLFVAPQPSSPLL